MNSNKGDLNWLNVSWKNEAVPVLYGAGDSNVYIDQKKEYLGSFSFVYLWFQDDLSVSIDNGRRTLSEKDLNAEFTDLIKIELRTDPDIFKNVYDIIPETKVLSMEYGSDKISMELKLMIGSWELRAFILEDSSGIVGPIIFSPYGGTPLPICWSENKGIINTVIKTFDSRICEDNLKRKERAEKRRQKTIAFA